MDYRQTVHANELEYHKYNSVLSTLNWDRMATPDKYTPEEYHRLYTESYRLRKEAAGTAACRPYGLYPQPSAITACPVRCR